MDWEKAQCLSTLASADIIWNSCFLFHNVGKATCLGHRRPGMTTSSSWTSRLRSSTATASSARPRVWLTWVTQSAIPRLQFIQSRASSQVPLKGQPWIDASSTFRFCFPIVDDTIKSSSKQNVKFDSATGKVYEELGCPQTTSATRASTSTTAASSFPTADYPCASPAFQQCYGSAQTYPYAQASNQYHMGSFGGTGYGSTASTAGHQFSSYDR